MHGKERRTQREKPKDECRARPVTQNEENDTVLEEEDGVDDQREQQPRSLEPFPKQHRSRREEEKKEGKKRKESKRTRDRRKESRRLQDVFDK
jgi:deoxyribodipyrimidine photolyase